jgi:hypothetical protein
MHSGILRCGNNVRRVKEAIHMPDHEEPLDPL